MINFKKGVEVSNVNTIIFLAIVDVCKIYRMHGAKRLTVTSISDGRDMKGPLHYDGKHMLGSLHYKGLAFDCRIWGFRGNELLNLVRDIRMMLGDGYDVILEKDHIHIEYDPE